MTPEEQSSQTSKQTTQTTSSGANSASNSGIGMKDLLIPVSVVVAGAFIGFGLFMGGGGAGEVQPVAQQPTGNGDAPTQQSLQDRLLGLVAEAEVDEEAFIACVEGQETVDLVQEDLDNAVATGGRGTPWSIVIGPGGKTYPLNGAVGAAQVEQVLTLARSEATQGPAGTAETDNVNPVTEADHVKGNPDGEITIVEYSDFDCPFCSRFHATLEQVIEDNADVAWVYRHFPLAQLHPSAPAVAAASECVAQAGGDEAFWVFADGYFGI